MSDPGIPGGGPPTRRLRPAGIMVGVCALVACAAGLGFWLGLTPPPPAEEGEVVKATGADEDIAQALAVVNPGYVGIEVCAECHAQRAATVKKSRHYLACRPAAEGVASPAFTPERGRFDTPTPGLRFEMARSGNDFLITRVEQTPRGERRDPFHVGLVYGSGGRHDEMYFAWEGDRLHHLPVAWLYPYDRWGQAAHASVPTQTHSSCLECHNTWVAHVPGSYNQYRRDEPMHLGVTCERCHGPGREHTDYHRSHPDSPSQGILHPGTLSRERLMDVCAQCHANAKRLGPAFAYRPGQPLESAFHNHRPMHQEDDTTNQVRYLSESKCYQKSEMTCISCHDPHRASSAKGKCLDCHEPAKCGAQPRLPEAVRGDCVGCHMPARVWTHAHLYTTADETFVPLAPRADHRIGVYPEASEAVILAWLRKQPGEDRRTEAEVLAAKVVQHWVNEGDRRLRASRFRGAMGAYREALRVSPDPQARLQLNEAAARQSKLDELGHALRLTDRADAAIPPLKKLLEINPNSALPHGELGNVYATMGRRDEAVPHLEAVARCEPGDAFGLTKLAWLADLGGRADEAAKLFAQAYKIDPSSAVNKRLWGQLLLRQKRWQDAEEKFRKVLLADPTDVAANRGLSEALRGRGDSAEAVRFARRAAHWSDGRDPEVLVTLADAYAAAGRAAEERKALNEALAAAERGNPALAPSIRERLRK